MSRTLTSCHLPSEIWIKLGIAPRKSNSVCSLIAALVERNGAHGNSVRHRSMVVESNAYTVLSSSRPNGSVAYNRRAMRIKAWANSQYKRQSHRSLASAKFLRVKLPRNPKMIRLGRVRFETRLDVPQALAKS